MGVSKTFNGVQLKEIGGLVAAMAAFADAELERLGFHPLQLQFFRSVGQVLCWSAVGPLPRLPCQNPTIRLTEFFHDF
jgi:hypothetical protein